MSKKQTLQDNSYGCGYVVDQNRFSGIEGRILTTIETIGLPEKQEQAIKSLIRRQVWEDFLDNVYIDSDFRTTIIKVKKIKQTEADERQEPMSALKLEDIK